MGNREAATAEAVKWISMLLPGSENAALIKANLDKMSDRQFDDYMTKLAAGEEVLPLVVPNLMSPSISKSRLTIERNLKVAKALGHKFFQRLRLTDPVTGKTYLTPLEYLVVDLPLRRQQQLLIKKISIPEDNRHVDELTGQPAGASHGSSLTFPELQVLYAQGMDRSIEELIKFRGGDTKAFQALSRQVAETGGASQDSIKRVPTRVKSTETLSVFLKSMHLDNNLT